MTVTRGNPSGSRCHCPSCTSLLFTCKRDQVHRLRRRILSPQLPIHLHYVTVSSTLLVPKCAKRRRKTQRVPGRSCSSQRSRYATYNRISSGSPRALHYTPSSYGFHTTTPCQEISPYSIVDLNREALRLVYGYCRCVHCIDDTLALSIGHIPVKRYKRVGLQGPQTNTTHVSDFRPLGHIDIVEPGRLVIEERSPAPRISPSKSRRGHHL